MTEREKHCAKRWSDQYDADPLKKLFGWNAEFHTGYMTPALRRLARLKVAQATTELVRRNGYARLPVVSLTPAAHKQRAREAKFPQWH